MVWPLHNISWYKAANSCVKAGVIIFLVKHLNTYIKLFLSKQVNTISYTERVDTIPR
jgi:hypothetical protein